MAKGVIPRRSWQGLRANFTGECTEVGMYLAMARVAHREGYPEIGLYWEKAAHEEAEHAAKFAELLGRGRDRLAPRRTWKCAWKPKTARPPASSTWPRRAKAATIWTRFTTPSTKWHSDEARHGKAFEGLLKRYFGK